MLKRFKSFLLALSLFFNFVFCGSAKSSAQGGKRLILYVTSMLSSTLTDVKNGNEIVWLDILKFLWDSGAAIECDDDGNSKNKNIVALNSTYGIKDENTKNSIKYGVYGSDKEIMMFLINHFGPNTKYNCDVVRFAYDWRKSCAQTAKELLKIIKKEEYTSVHIVCYSQGGRLVSLAINELLKEYDNTTLDKIKSYIFVAVPFYGTLEPWFVFENGMRTEDNLLLRLAASMLNIYEKTKKLTINFKSMYELFPSKEYYEFEQNAKKTAEALSVNSYGGMKKSIEESSWYRKKDGKSKSFLADAEKVYDKLRKGGVYEYLAKNENCFFICGTGIDTLYRLGYDKNKNLLVSEVASGDYGMVYKSAFPQGTDESRVFPVEKIKHTEMVKNKVVLDKISNILEKFLAKVV